MRNSIGIAPSRRPPRYVATPALRGDESGRGVPRRAVYDWRVTTGASRAAEAPVGPSAAYRNSGMSLANSSIRRISSSQGMKPWSMIARSDATSASTPLSRRCRRSVGDLLFFGAQRGRLLPGTVRGPPSGATCCTAETVEVHCDPTRDGYRDVRLVMGAAMLALMAFPEMELGTT